MPVPHLNVVRATDPHEVAGLVAQSGRMRQILGSLPAIARSNLPVLLRGESGTGKDHLARAIHELSDRQNMPLVKFSGTAINKQLEGRGSQCSCGCSLPHWLEPAKDGTLFLDKVTDLSATAQARLLDIIQHELFSCATMGPRIRLISASRPDLETASRKGNFREDVYYRLKVIVIDLPPLVERREDIPFLVERVLKRSSQRHEYRVHTISDDALQMLGEHHFPGNVRELENVVEHAIVMSNTGHLEMADFPPYLCQGTRSRRRPSKQRTRRSPSHDEVVAALLKHHFSKTLASRELGIHRSTLWRRIQKLQLAEE